jgi:hypothetical protein
MNLNFENDCSELAAVTEFVINKKFWKELICLLSLPNLT